MPLTAKDIKNAVRIHFSYNGIKLWENEKNYKRVGKDNYIAVRDSGYPAGYPDLMGYKVGSGQVVGVEVKTINDTIKPAQIDALNLMISDGCQAYTATENADGNIDLINWETNEKRVILCK